MLIYESSNKKTLLIHQKGEASRPHDGSERNFHTLKFHIKPYAYSSLTK